MSENYFYSSLSAQEIEDTLVGAVVANAAQSLTTSQKAQARANIGAGAVDTGLIIKGYYATAADLESAHPIAAEGDVYMVGTAAPYDTYIWDAVNMEWKNNGALTPGDSTIDDNDISSTHTWSSSKINAELGDIETEMSGKQDTLTFDDIPTDSSDNPVKSGGVYDAIEEAKALYLTGVTVSVATNATIVSVSNAAITANHVLVSCVFANQSAITTDVAWSTAAGSLTMTGTCVTATTCDIVLVAKA